MIIDGTKRQEENTSLGGGATGATLTPASGGVSQRPTSSGRFTNLQKYISANKGQPNRTLEKAKEDVTGLEKNYSQSMEQMQNAYQKGMDEYGNVRQAQQYQRSVAQDPTKGVDVNLYNRSTTPSNDYIGQYSKARESIGGLRENQQTLGQLGSQGGVRNYLQSIRGNRPGSLGGESLDTFLLSQPEAQTQLGSIAERAKNVNLDVPVSQMDDLQSAYTQIQGYDPESTKNLLRQNIGNVTLDAKDPNSVARYNALQSLIGGKQAQLEQAPIVTTPTDKRYGGMSWSENAKEFYDYLQGGEGSDEEKRQKWNEFLILNPQNPSYDQIVKGSGIQG